MALAQTNPSSQPAHQPRLEVACEEMCAFCFDVLINHHNPRHIIPRPSFPNDRLASGEDIFKFAGGHPWGMSALRDSRFQPIAWEEISRLDCAVSLLTNFEQAENYLDWEIGTHGIRIEFKMRGDTKTATYLPEVASEHGWDKMETIVSLLKKGGYQQHVTQEFCRTIRLTRYRSEKVRMSYNDYAHFRSLVAQGKR